nr:hypothetical protein [Gammaproteobacteria bacterium]
MKVPSMTGLSQPRRELTKFWLKYRSQIIGLVAVVLVAAVVNVALDYFTGARQSASANTLDRELNGFRSGFSSEFRAFEESISKRLDLMKLPDLLRGEDTREADTALESFAAEDERVLGARFLPVGFRGVDTDANPPLGYAALEMLQRAEDKGGVRPEVLFHGTDKQHLAMLRRVDVDGQTMGHVFLAARVDVMQATLDQVAANLGGADGYAEVLQTVAGAKPLVLAKSKSANPWPGVPAGQQPVSG